MADYSATIIYTIRCKNSTVTDLYVGHTTDFVKRRYAHKQSSCNNDIKLKLYETIRKNGGWDNWKMEIIHHFSCDNANEARVKEQEYYVSLKATLNSIEPHKIRDIQLIIPKDVGVIRNAPIIASGINLVSNKHVSLTNDIVKYKFVCKVCNYSTTKESNWNKHIQTTKHKLQGKPRTYNCSTCDKQYNVYKSLWSHEKVCGLAITSQLLMTENKSLHTIIQSHSTTISAITTQNESIANYMKDASDTMTSYMKDTSEMMRNVLDITKSISIQPVV